MIKNNVVSINRKKGNKSKKFSGFSAYSTQKRNSLEEIFLSVGSFASIAVLQVICIAVFGFPQSILFAVGISSGIFIGFIVYKFFPAQTESYFNLQEVRHETSIDNINNRKAA